MDYEALPPDGNWLVRMIRDRDAYVARQRWEFIHFVTASEYAQHLEQCVWWRGWSAAIVEETPTDVLARTTSEVCT